MSWRRKTIYLILIAPLHHLLSVIAALPAMLLAPPDILIQMILPVPLYATALWWVVPAFQRVMGFTLPTSRIVTPRALILTGGFATLALAIVAVLFGFATPIEALVLAAVTLTAFHAWLIRAF